MGLVRLLGGLSIAVTCVRCRTAPDKVARVSLATNSSANVALASEPSAVAITAEPTPRQPDCFDCDGPSSVMLTIVSSKRGAGTLLFIDGMPVDRGELANSLNAKRELEAQIGAPPVRELYVDAAKDVPPVELGKAIQMARSFGYDQIKLITRHVNGANPKSKNRAP